MLRASDLISGLAVAGLGAFILLQSRNFPQVGGIGVAPSFYPGVIGGVLLLCGLSLAATSVRRGEALPLADKVDWFRRPGNVVAVASVPASIVLYGLLSQPLGFLATCFLVSAGLLLAFRVRLVICLVTALFVTAALYLIFVTLFRVPLPYGVIERLLP